MAGHPVGGLMPADDLHHEDGSHRTTARTADGRDLERFDARIRNHLRQHAEREIPMTAPTRIEFDLELDKILTAGYRQTGEDDYEPQPTTLEDVLCDRAAAKLLDQAGDKVRDRLRHRVQEIRDEEIRAAVRPAVEEALTAPIRRTNTLGEPTGEETTLRQMVLAEAQALLTSSRYQREPTILEKMVRDEVGRGFAGELKKALDAAKEEVMQAVRDKGAEVLAETIQRMARA